MVNKPDKNVSRLRRHRRVRGKISGTAACPRLDVFRSSKHIYAQLIDDVAGVTLASASSMDKDFEGFGGFLCLSQEGSSFCASRSVLLTRASRKRCMTAAALYITAVSRLWLRAPARAAWSCKEDTNGND